MSTARADPRSDPLDHFGARQCLDALIEEGVELDDVGKVLFWLRKGEENGEGWDVNTEHSTRTPKTTPLVAACSKKRSKTAEFILRLLVEKGAKLPENSEEYALLREWATGIAKGAEDEVEEGMKMAGDVKELLTMIEFDGQEWLAKKLPPVERSSSVMRQVDAILNSKRYKEGDAPLYRGNTSDGASSASSPFSDQHDGASSSPSSSTRSLPFARSSPSPGPIRPFSQLHLSRSPSPLPPQVKANPEPSSPLAPGPIRPFSRPNSAASTSSPHPPSLRKPQHLFRTPSTSRSTTRLTMKTRTMERKRVERSPALPKIEEDEVFTPSSASPATVPAASLRKPSARKKRSSSASSSSPSLFLSTKKKSRLSPSPPSHTSLGGATEELKSLKFSKKDKGKSKAVDQDHLPSLALSPSPPPSTQAAKTPKAYLRLDHLPSPLRTSSALLTFFATQHPLSAVLQPSSSSAFSTSLSHAAPSTTASFALIGFSTLGGAQRAYGVAKEVEVDGGGRTIQVRMWAAEDNKGGETKVRAGHSLGAPLPSSAGPHRHHTSLCYSHAHFSPYAPYANSHPHPAPNARPPTLLAAAALAQRLYFGALPHGISPGEVERLVEQRTGVKKKVKRVENDPRGTHSWAIVVFPDSTTAEFTRKAMHGTLGHLLQLEPVNELNHRKLFSLSFTGLAPNWHYLDVSDFLIGTITNFRNLTIERVFLPDNDGGECLLKARIEVRYETELRWCFQALDNLPVEGRSLRAFVETTRVRLSMEEEQEREKRSKVRVVSGAFLDVGEGSDGRHQPKATSSTSAAPLQDVDMSLPSPYLAIDPSSSSSANAPPALSDPPPSSHPVVSATSTYSSGRTPAPSRLPLGPLQPSPFLKTGELDGVVDCEAGGAAYNPFAPGIWAAGGGGGGGAESVKMGEKGRKVADGWKV
ncbi:hypothetical protein JCM8547_006263 [Rhodosporidiobolus lusitaniae]